MFLLFEVGGLRSRSQCKYKFPKLEKEFSENYILKKLIFILQMVSYVALGLALISFSGFSLAQDCPFGPGSCPVTLGEKKP